MNRDPDISVVMSVRNGGAALRETAESVLGQSDVNLEFVVVDDGSTDETPAVLADLACSDSRVRVHAQPNAGITSGLVRGCAMARGKYIARQDVGDFSHCNRMARQAAALDGDAETSFVSCWTEVLGPRMEHLTVSTGSGRASAPTFIIEERAKHGVIDGPSHHGSVMFRREHYLRAGGYRTQFYFGQDWDLWYRLAELGKFRMVPETLYRARLMPNSLSGRHKAAQEAIGRLSHEALLRRLRGEPETDVLERARQIRPPAPPDDRTASVARGMYFIGEQLRRNGDYRAEEYFRDSIAVAPGWIKPRVRMAQIVLSKLLGSGRHATKP